MDLRTVIRLFALGVGLASGTAQAATFSVDSTVDAVDSAPGDGVCMSAGAACTLRAAVMEANAFAGADIIDLTAINDPLDPIVLTIDGVDETFTLTPGGAAACVAVVEPDAARGDLDVTEDVTIQGAGPGLTMIQWDAQSITDPDVGDRIFHVQANPGETVNRVRIADVMVTRGSVGIPADLDPANPYNCDVTGAAGSRRAWQFRRFGGGIAIGAGAAVVLFDEALHGSGGEEPRRPAEADAGVINAVELARVAVIGNRSGADAGGLDIAAATAIAESVLSANQASGNGGALYLGASSTIDATLIGDSAVAVPYLSGPVPAALLAPNVAANGGGVFATGFHTSAIDRSAINFNEATGGGGIAGRSLVTLNVSNTTVSGNKAADVGGGMTTGGTINLRNVTLANNRGDSVGDTGGGGLNASASGAFVFFNTILSNNVVQGSAAAPREVNCGCTGRTQCLAGEMVSTGFNVSDDATNTCGLSLTRSDKLDTDPLLGPLTSNGGLTETHRLPSADAGDPATSPALDAADNTRCPNNDQRGSLRPEDGDQDDDFDCDIGAFELFIARGDLNVGNVIAPDQVGKGDTFEVVVEIRNDNAGSAAPAVTYVGTVTPATGLPIVDADPSVGSCVVAPVNVVNCAIGDMAIGAVETVTLRLSGVAQGDYTLRSVVANAPSLVDPVPGNNTVTSRIDVVGSSDIALSVNLDDDSAAVDGDFTFDFMISNNGEDDASNIRLGVVVPASVSFFSASYSPIYSCFWALREFVCVAAELAEGETATFRLIVTAEATGDYEFLATTAADQDDPDLANNAVATAVTIVERPARGNGGGGCAYNPGQAFDPTLPGLLAAALLALCWRRRRAR